MNCIICRHGQAAPGCVTVSLQRNGCTVVFKEVPADVCDNCGEHYLSEGVTEDLLRCSETAAARGTEVEIQRYAA
jgi:YgiT-type zinc finger domain-containing protein